MGDMKNISVTVYMFAEFFDVDYSVEGDRSGASLVVQGFAKLVVALMKVVLW